MAPFYGWGSTASRLEPLEEAVYFLPLVLLTSKEQKVDSTLKLPSDFEHRTPS